MIGIAKHFLYRIFCILAFLAAICLVIDRKISKTLDYKMVILFLLFSVVVIWGIIEWKNHYDVIQKQEEELKMYELYIKPLEELVKEIRSKQHEFDNHLNAVLNLHLTVDNYQELVQKQSEYILSLSGQENKNYISILKIADKVLAGFLYSKLIGAPDFLEIQVQIQNPEIISGISEHDLVEIVGILTDNAFEACTKERNRVLLQLDSFDDRMVFEIKNEVGQLSISEMEKFFEKGYSTKEEAGKGGRRGYGLSRARFLVEKNGGELTVGIDKEGEHRYIDFHVKL